MWFFDCEYQAFGECMYACICIYIMRYYGFRFVYHYYCFVFVLFCFYCHYYFLVSISSPFDDTFFSLSISPETLNHEHRTTKQVDFSSCLKHTHRDVYIYIYAVTIHKNGIRREINFIQIHLFTACYLAVCVCVCTYHGSWFIFILFFFIFVRI